MIGGLNSTHTNLGQGWDARGQEMDTDIGTELFAGYENDFNLIIADISSKLQGLQDQEGEARKAALRAAERAIEEAEEIAPAPARAAAAVTLTS